MGRRILDEPERKDAAANFQRIVSLVQAEAVADPNHHAHLWLWMNFHPEEFEAFWNDLMRKAEEAGREPTEGK